MSEGGSVVRGLYLCGQEGDMAGGKSCEGHYSGGKGGSCKGRRRHASGMVVISARAAGHGH